MTKYTVRLDDGSLFHIPNPSVTGESDINPDIDLEGIEVYISCEADHYLADLKAENRKLRMQIEGVTEQDIQDSKFHA